MRSIKGLAVMAMAAAMMLSAKGQTNTTSSFPLTDTLTAGSNYFVVPFGTYAPKAHTFGGGLAVGYKATDYLAPIVRLDEFGGKAYLGNISLQLSVPRRLMGKVPLVPMLVAGAGIPLSSATMDSSFTISAGQPVGIVGIGAYIPFDWAGSSWFAQHAFLPFTYEHWTGAGIPSSQQNQWRFGLGIKF